MKQILCFILLSTSVQVFAQSNKYKKVKINESFRWNNSTQIEVDSFYFNLPAVRNSDYKTHIRIYFAGQTIDFMSNDNLTYSGLLMNYISEYQSKSSKYGYSNNRYAYIFEKIKLDTNISTSLINKLFELRLDTLPTDSLMSEWKSGFLHCDRIDVQLKRNDNCNYMKYHCPWGQNETLIYRKNILNIYEMLLSHLELEYLYEKFTSQLKRGKTYSKDGYQMIYLPAE